MNEKHDTPIATFEDVLRLAFTAGFNAGWLENSDVKETFIPHDEKSKIIKKWFEIWRDKKFSTIMEKGNE